MFSEELIARLAAELHEAEKSRVQVEHFSKRFPGMTIEDGYAVSRAWVKMKIAEGRVARGHKIGLTSRAMQQASQIDEPDYGTLLDDMFFEPGDIPADRFIAPRVEVELAFVLKRKLEGASISVDQVLEATEYVTPAIEIIDARIEQFDRHTKAMRRVQDTISDNAANAGIVLGGRTMHPTRAGPALVRRHPAAKRRGRGNRPGRRRPGASRHRRGLAGHEAGALGRVPASRRGRAGRLVHPPRGRQERRRVRRRLWPRWAASNSDSSEGETMSPHVHIRSLALQAAGFSPSGAPASLEAARREA